MIAQLNRQIMRTLTLGVGLVLVCCAINPLNAQTSQTTQPAPVTADLLKQQPQQNKVPADVPQDWYQKATQNLQQSGYYLRPMGQPDDYAAVNAKHNLGFMISPEGYKVKNIHDGRENNPAWEFNFGFKGIHRHEGATSNRSLKGTNAIDNTLEYYFGGYTIQYINNEAGMRQNFIVNEVIQGKGPLEVTLSLSGDLEPSITDANTLVLHESGNDKAAKLVYDNVKVWDANNKILAANMAINSNHELVLSVNDEHAAYPITIDPLNHAPDWTDSGSGLLFSVLDDLTAPLLYGYSVSGAGDVNGDGFDDVIIGAPAYVDILSVSGGTFNAASVGAAFVYYGSATGLSADPKEVLQPTSTVGALFGYSVSNAGDVDGDGKGDVIIGAPGDKVNINLTLGNVDAAVGKVYVYRGSQFDGNVNSEPTASATVSLKQADFGTPLITPANPLYGFSVSTAGDVNGDGKDDIIVGAPAYTNLLTLQLGGRADIYHGSASGIGSTPARIITGGLAGGQFGYSVSTAGKVNNDNYADVIVGAPGSVSLSAVGSAYVFHGSATGITATATTGANTALSSPGLLLSTLFGSSVAAAGDVNGDGRGDVIIGEPLSLELFGSSTVAVGKANIYYGSNSGILSTGRTQLTSPRKPGAIGSIAGNLLYGFSVSGVKDVNCDGIDDVIVGEPGGTSISLGTGLLGLVSANALSGNAYIYYGKNTTGPVDNPAFTYGESGNSVSAANLIGYSVKGTGDTNGDGKSDFIIGAPNGTLNLSSSLLGIVGNTLNYVTTNSVGNAFGYNGCINVLPLAVDDAVTTAEDTPVTFNVTTNDSDPDGTINVATVDLNVATAGIQNTATTAQGTWAVAATGAVTFTPLLNYNGPAILTYRVNDNSGGTSNTATITVTVTPVNDPPVANNDVISTNEDTPGTVNVTSNDTDVDGTINAATVDLDPATAGIQNSFTNPSGTWTVNATGVVTYTPTANFNGAAAITYTVNDNSGATSNAATISATVISVNDAPVAVNDNATTNEDTPVTFSIVANDTDVDGTIDATSVDLDPATAGKQSTRTTASGTWSVSPSGQLTYTPTLNFNGSASITYTVNDNGGLTSNIATIGVTVTSVNDAPVAVNDNPVTDEDTPIVFNVTSNDTDVDGTIAVNTVDLDPVTAGVQTSITTAQGTFTVDASGNVTFTPVTNFNGSAVATYTVKDNDGLLSNVGTITVSVTSVNDAPVAVNDNATTAEDNAVVINAVANDTDADGTIAVATVDLDPAAAGIQNTKTNAGGTWTADATGKVTYTPTLNFNGPASVTYTVNDNGGATSNVATISVNVTSVNDAPVAVSDNATTNEDTPVSFSVTANDTDVDGTIDATTVDLDPATGGKQSSITTPAGTWTVNAAGSVTYTPTLNFNGSASISYTVNDNGGLTSNIASISVTINSVNDAPVAVNDNAATQQNNAVSFNVTANDSDVDGTIDATTVDLDPATGGKQSSIATAAGAWSVDATGKVTFTPVPAFTGTATLTYTVKDNNGLDSNVATISVNVTTTPVVNNAPVAVNDNATTNKGVAVTINVTSNDTDSDGTIDASTVDLDPATGGIQNSLTNGFGNWAVNASGVVTFTPGASIIGSATVTYTVKDNSAATSNIATVTVLIAAPPVAVDDSFTINEDSQGTINVTLNDTDADGTINTATVDLDPGTAGIQNSFFNGQGTWSVAPTGIVTFTPTANFNGPATMTYTVKDNTGLTSNIATITANVTSVNDAPVAVNDNATTAEDNAITFSITANDTDIDGTIVASTVDLDPATPLKQSTLTTASGTWSVNAAGALTYTPALNYNGSASITYTVNDNGGLTSNIATITVTVTPVNDAPVAVNDNANVDEDNAVTFSVVSNDTDVDGTIAVNTVDLDPATVGVQTTFTTAAGSWSVDATGKVTFTPVANYNGTATKTYTVNDNLGLVSNIATISVVVDPVNDPPIAVNDNSTALEDAFAVVDVIANDYDTDGSIVPATVDLDSAPGIQNTKINAAGTWTAIFDGKVTYTPTPNFNGTASITYTVNDNGGATSNSATVSILVTPVNDTPIAVNDNATVNEDSPVTFSVVANDSDPDGSIDATTVDLDQTIGGIQNSVTTSAGTFTVDASGNVTFTPVANFYGAATATYTVRDNGGLTSNTATIAVQVDDLNDAPVAVDDSFIIDENLTITVNILTNDYDADGTIDQSSVDLDPTTSLVQSTLNNAQGAWSVSAIGQLTFVPIFNFSGAASINYTVKDNDGATSNVATVSATINWVNAPPIARNDSTTTYEGVPVSFDIVTNDTDIDGNLDVTSVAMSTLLGAQQQYVFPTPDGIWNLNVDGEVTFDPAPGFVGIVTVPYTVSDQYGRTSNLARIKVTVLPDPALIAGVAKAVTAPVLQDDGSSKMTFTFTVKNFSAQTINKIVLTDTLTKAFPSPLTYKVVTGTSTGHLVYNSSFDGSANPNLLASTSTLSANETQTVSLTLLVYPNGNPGAFSNYATLQVTSDDGTDSYTDTSDEGIVPDTNGNGNPSDPGEDDPTTVNVLGDTDIHIDKIMVATPKKNDDCSYEITFSVNITNSGEVDFTNVQIVDDLSVSIPLPTTYRILSITSEDVIVNTNFDGRYDKNLLAAGNTLRTGDQARVQYTVLMTPNEQYGPFTNRVNVTAVDDHKTPFEYSTEPTSFSVIPQEVFIPEGFSPNGDGVHDTFQITLTCGLYAKLLIFNRWGEKVYYSDDYKNDWTGVAEQGSFMGKALPEGTYFYTCELSSGTKITSFLTIKH